MKRRKSEEIQTVSGDSTVRLVTTTLNTIIFKVFVFSDGPHLCFFKCLPRRPTLVGVDNIVYTFYYYTDV